MPRQTLHTPRLQLVPMTLTLVEAVMGAGARTASASWGRACSQLTTTADPGEWSHIVSVLAH